MKNFLIRNKRRIIIIASLLLIIFILNETAGYIIGKKLEEQLDKQLLNLGFDVTEKNGSKIQI